MRTIMKSMLALAVIILAFSFTSVAQTAKPFTGTITYSITYAGNIDAATMAQLPKITTVKVMGNKQKTEIPYGPVTIWVQNDGDKKEAMLMLDQMGQKIYYKLNEAEIEEDYSKNGTPEITYSDETKTIAGYVCKKAEFKTFDADGNSQVSVVYYTEELGGAALNYGSNFQGLKGLPLEYTTPQGDFTVTNTATEVKKGKVKDLDFLVPSDFIECTPEEKAQLRSMFSGGE